MSIAKLLPEAPVDGAHADVLLEIAYLATAADGRLDDDELAAFRGVVARLKNDASPTDKQLDALLDRFAGNVEHAEIHDRIRTLAPQLPAELRAVAFKLAVALSLTDLDTNDDEADLHEALATALGLDAEQVDALTADVYAAFDAGAD